MFLISLLFSALFATTDVATENKVLPRPALYETTIPKQYFNLAGAQCESTIPKGTVAESWWKALTHNPHNNKGGIVILQPLPTDDTSFRTQEAYGLHISSDTLKVFAATSLGFLRAAQTLWQLRDAQGRIPCGRMADAPVYEWRGAMLDVSRHFFSLDFLRRQIDLLSAYKFNRLHLHLTDAAGWRMEIKRYPRLTQLGAWRDAALWKTWWDGTRKYLEEGTPGAYGGYYTQEELRALVAYAAARGVEIVPEIEMPAHSEEALTAYPEYSCTHEPYKQADFCAGNEGTYEFLQNILDEVMDIFPSRYLHIGGDEAGKASWKTCPLCRQRMLETGILTTDTMPNDDQLHQLQAHFIRRIGTYLHSKGRRMIGWDEVNDPTLPEGAAVMLWRNSEYAQKAAEWGHEIILSPASHCYLDAYQDAPPSQPEAIGGYLPFEDVANFAPESLVSNDLQHLIKGVQGNLWTEYVPTEQHVEYMLYPRLLALAEIGWCGPSRRQPEALQRAAEYQIERLQADGVNTFNLRTAVGQRDILRPVRHKAVGAKVSYALPYHTAYAAGGDTTLVDGRRGGWSYHDRRWQGFIEGEKAGQPRLDVTLDLGKAQRIARVSADFMQVCNPDIFYPSAFRVSVSSDGIDFTPFGEETFPSERTELPDVRTFSVKGKANARYLRIEAEPSRFGGWLFTDEIVVE